jgi:diguanylate cyclase (GGDEF)-like protein
VNNIADVLSAASHSQDFNQVRAETVFRRVRILAVAFALAAPLWLPLDWYFLDDQRFRAFFMLRLGWTGAFLGLALWSGGRHRLGFMRLRLAVLVAVPAGFYAASRLILDGGAPSAGVLMGYAFLPLLMAAVLGIFPLTLREGIGYAAILAAAVVATDLAYGSLSDILRIRDLWLLGLLFVVAFWAQLSQLGMLLRLHREATRDPLTGLVNRRVLMRSLKREVAEAQRQGEPLSVLLFDLDLFKRVNDAFGHVTGDRVLTRFAAVLERHLPERGMAGRYGGEEFMVVLPGWKRESARERAEAIRRSWVGTWVEGPDGEGLRLTVSIGVASLQGGGDSPEALVERVDEGLYEAKEAGRNLVVTAG